MNETTKNVGITEFDSNFFDNASKCWKENKTKRGEHISEVSDFPDDR